MSSAPDETPWREPDPPVEDGLSRRLRQGPSARVAWLKIAVMVAALITLLNFHDRMTTKAAGCFQQSTGLLESPPESSGTPPR